MQRQVVQRTVGHQNDVSLAGQVRPQRMEQLGVQIVPATQGAQAMAGQRRRPPQPAIAAVEMARFDLPDASRQLHHVQAVSGDDEGHQAPRRCQVFSQVLHLRRQIGQHGLSGAG